MPDALWPTAGYLGTVTKARAKLSWTAFEQVHHDAVRLAYDLWPASEEATWLGLSVFAIEGSKYRLPASAALRKAFDPDSGLEHPGRGHYPQCLVSTVYDVFRRLPIARTVQSIAHADEREEVKILLPHIPSGGVLLCDRGYPSYDLIGYLLRHYQGYGVIRCPAAATFAAVEAFVQSGQTEATLTLTPPKAEPITLRAVRLVSPDGELSVLRGQGWGKRWGLARAPALAKVSLESQAQSCREGWRPQAEPIRPRTVSQSLGSVWRMATHCYTVTRSSDQTRHRSFPA
jgi:hypothetical protein